MPLSFHLHAGAHVPPALDTSVPLLRIALRALAALDLKHAPPPLPPSATLNHSKQAQPSLPAPPSLAAATSGQHQLQACMAPCSSSSSSSSTLQGEEHACRLGRCLLSVCLAARWALYHLQHRPPAPPAARAQPMQPANPASSSSSSSSAHARDQADQPDTAALLSSLLQLALEQLGSKLQAWQGSMLATAATAAAAAAASDSGNQAELKCCVGELRAQLEALAAELDQQQQQSSTAACGLEVPGALVAAVQRYAAAFLAVHHPRPPLPLAWLPHSATQQRTAAAAGAHTGGAVCHGSCMAWLAIFGRAEEGCGACGLHR